MMSSLLDAALKVTNFHALSAFLGVLLLIAIGWMIHSHGKGVALGKRQSDLMALALKLLFGLAALAMVALSSSGEGMKNSAGCNSGLMSNTSNR